MAPFPIDISGKNGLSQYQSQNSRNAYAVPDGQYISGVMNPFIRYGYLSPPNNSTTAVTADFTENSAFRTRLYDAVNDNFYVGENGALAKGSTMSATSITRILLTPGSNADSITDLKAYMLNGVRKFYAMYDNAAGNAEIAVSSFPTTVITVTIANPAVVTLVAHGLIVGSTITFATTGALPTGITAGTTYYVIAGGLAANTFEISASAGGAAVVTSGSQSGTHSIWITNFLTGMVTGGVTQVSAGDFFMVQSHDSQYVYLFAENYVHKLDGTVGGGASGTLTPNVLLFPTGYRIVDAVDIFGSMFIAFHNYGNNTRSVNPTVPSGPTEVGVLVWNKVINDITNQTYIPLRGFNEICKIFLSVSGKIRIIAIDSNGYTQLLEYNGSTFNILYKIGFNAKPLFRDAVSFFGPMDMWFGQDGNLYMYGPTASGDFVYTPDGFNNKEALYIIKNISLSSTSGGVILSALGTSTTSPGVYITYKDVGGSFQFIRISVYTITGQTGGTTAGTGLIVFPVKILPVYSKVAYLKVPCIPTASTGATVIATIKVYINQQTTVFQSYDVTQKEASTGMVDIPLAKVGVWAIQLEIDWATNAIGSDDFCVHTAFLEYEPIEKRK